MTIKEMHYDLKFKLNKVDSQQYKNLLIPEIDWVLNEAQELFVKMVAKPRRRSHLGFEIGQRTIDDISPLVVNEIEISVTNFTSAKNSIATLPSNYWHYLKSDVMMTKGSCTKIKGKVHIRQHDDDFEGSPFDKSSFEWRSINAVFYQDGIKFYTDGTFLIDKFHLSYLKKLSHIHNAEDFRTGEYKLPEGTVLTGSVDCELPPHTHREIVDIAVLMITGQMQRPDYQIQMTKLSLNDLK